MGGEQLRLKIQLNSYLEDETMAFSQHLCDLLLPERQSYWKMWGKKLANTLPWSHFACCCGGKFHILESVLSLVFCCTHPILT